MELYYLDKCEFSPTLPVGFSPTLPGQRMLIRYEAPLAPASLAPLAPALLTCLGGLKPRSIARVP